jgi:erythromycin esterase-like protein
MWLREGVGTNMYIVGFAIHKGAFRTHDAITFHIPPGTSGSGDAVFSAVGIPLLFLDLRTVPAKTVLANWISTPQSFWSAGAGNSQEPADSMRDLIVAKAFDGLIFIEESHASRLLQVR